MQQQHPHAQVISAGKTSPILFNAPAGHRVTLVRRHLIGRATVITTNANPSHADALADLRHQFKATTGRPYLPRRGDTLIHTF